MITDFSLDRKHPIGLAQQIADRIRTAIEQGGFVSGQKLPTERELARLFRVTKDTVRRALAQLSERGLILKRRSRGSFVASTALLSQTRTRRHVHVYLSMDAESPWEGLIRGLSRELHHQGMDLLLKDIHGWTPADLKAQLLSSLEQAPAGLIVYPYFLELLAPFYNGLCRRGVPVILVDAGLHTAAEAVLVDEEEGVSLALRHLYALGHRRFGCVSVVTSTMREYAERRLAAFRSVCSELNVLSSARLLTLETERLDRPPAHVAPAGVAAIRAALEGDDGATGLVCYNDSVAARVAAVAEGMGWRIPRDLSVVGFDNDPAVAAYARPLTTVDPRMVEMGRTAARRLLKLSAAVEQSLPCKTCVRPVLVVRESTGPAPVRKRTAAAVLPP